MTELGQAVATKTYYVQTYGCQMNVYDSEIIAALLEQQQYQSIDDMSKADVVVFNTCCIRDNADQKVYGRLGDFKNYKAAKPSQILVVAGCLAQKDQQAMLDRFPQVDIVLGTHQVQDLPMFIEQVQANRKAKGRQRSGTGQVAAVARKGDHLDLQASPRTVFSAMVPISVGCNQWCTYCIVPYVRGPLKSRPLSQIVGELTRLAAAGYREITLLGQNVNDYGRDFAEPLDFADVLDATRDIQGLDRLRFTSPHPAYFGQRVIDSMASNPRVCEHVHLPLQSGDDQILATMKRGYTGEQFIDLANRMRQAIPGLGITTDIIVGFAGETEEQFQHTLDVVRQVEFDSAFMFAYSERPGTPGSMFKSQVPEPERMERLYRLIEVQNRISEDKHRQRLGQVVEVLVEGPSKKDSRRFTGRTRQHWLVHFDVPGECDLVGKMVKVRLETAFMWGFVGVLQ